MVAEHAGTEATESFEDVGHSSDARSILKEHKIGELSEEEKAKASGRAAPPEQPSARLTRAAGQGQGDREGRLVGQRRWIRPVSPLP